mmetsp:Transcript_31793/g.74254  ORF Transcript_31793/g.74254 Transcript_31793/m.74254 type:complete len:391 (-) Transcript_31793:67-1239(-)|eukprot:CAMPEP_0178390070 /NCGR_PEP_ID=MMETSP0689_2-20121128/10454_1 /TAXON_ID=160604 /ORGANISM="Amphidinium massartii, Strain CS-259" /LENGTH=390 /DNA_ID=CAMNT_0020010563 /DNA_START=62 /DNA_END=1234 /DNA_ORIENTATION=+
MWGLPKTFVFFVPAICVYQVWLTIALREDVLTEAVSEFYPMMIAMVLGSMIAGSTPLGGGVVAFPVSVLVLGFKPAQGRDFSLLIQSVGMTAASFLIFSKKGFLLEECMDMLPKFCVLSITGLIVGFEVFSNTSPYIMNIVYTLTVTCVALVLAYLDIMDRHEKPTTTPVSNASHAAASKVAGDANDVESAKHGEKTNSPSGADMASTMQNSNKPARQFAPLFVEVFCLPVFALVGGILSSQIGTGADIACFLYGCFFNKIRSWCGHTSVPQVSGNALTAASVIVMANTSIFGSILRATTQADASAMVKDEVYLALVACSPVVVLGAPFGSLLLTPSNQQWLRYLFYLLAFLQLVLFGLIKIRDDYKTWSVVAGVIVIVVTCLGIHRFHT